MPKGFEELRVTRRQQAFLTGAAGLQLRIAHEEWAGDQVCTRVGYGRVLLLCVLSGHGRLTSPAQSDRFGPDHLLQLVPGVAHTMAIDTPLRLALIASEDPAIQRCCRETLGPHCAVWPIRNAGRIQEYLQLLGHVIEDGGPDVIATAWPLVHSLLAAIVSGRQPLGIADGSERQLMQEARHWLETHAAEPVGVADMARALHVHRSHLSRLWKRIAGTSPSAALMELRMERARSLLAESELPIGAIATRCGYGDHFAFTKAFTRSQGESPQAWRQRIRPA